MSTRDGFDSIMLFLVQNAFAWVVQRKVQKGHLEVERKFSISAAEAESLPIRLRELNFRPVGSVVMTDTFIPPRTKGEMLRVRDEVMADSARSVFTMKSWVYRGGHKERQESEAEVSPFIRTLAIILGRMASGRNLLNFSKERALFEGSSNGKEMVACIDRVSGLGQYSGYFVEVECIVPLGQDPADARNEIYKFVEQLFGTPREEEKNSYLEMLKMSLQK